MVFGGQDRFGLDAMPSGVPANLLYRIAITFLSITDRPHHTDSRFLLGSYETLNQFPLGKRSTYET